MITYPPGTPCWIDLSSTDVPASQAFYSELFGWEGTERAPADRNGGYWIFTLDGKDVAGLASSQTPGQPPYWMTYIAVDDADEAGAAIAAAGGQELFEPFTVMEDGRMGVFRDGADGAIFSVWQPLSFKGAQAVNQVGAWAWGELDTRDTGGAAKFYAEAFGWKLAPIEQDGQTVYGSWSLDGRLIGGLLPMGPQFPPTIPASWIAYFGVDDVDATRTRVEGMGGRALTDAMDVPNGRFLALMDPQGAAFAVLQGSYDPPPGG
jgi:predicted enzyme related to lactoylglutathione lyase